MTIEEIKTNRRKQLMDDKKPIEEELIELAQNALGQSFNDITRKLIDYKSSTISVWFQNHNEIVIGKCKYKSKITFYVADRYKRGFMRRYDNFADALIAAETGYKKLSGKWWQFWK